MVGSSKTYVALFAEAEGFALAHFHVVPRHLDLDPGLRAPRIFGLLGEEVAGDVPSEVMDQLAVSIGKALRLGS